MVLDAEGNVLCHYEHEDDAREATMTGEYPDDVEVAYLSNPVAEDAVATLES